MNENINILVIEDSQADAKLLNIYLKETFAGKFSLTVADFLWKGLQMLKENTYDIIILDLSLPDSSGIDTFKSVHAAASEKPIIVLTGLEDESVGINTVKLGAQDFIIKGRLDSRILKRSINYSIERYKLLQSLAEKTKMLEEKTVDLLNEKQKLALAQKLAHIGSWEWNIKDNLFSCSDELVRILKLEPDRSDLSYEEFLCFTHTEDRASIVAEINKAIVKREPFEYFHRIVRRDGSIRYLQTKGELILDNDGEVLRVTGTEQDITQRKKEEHLEQLAMVAIKSYNAVIIADKEGKIEWVNDGFTRLFGYKLKDVKGTSGEILRMGEKTGISPENEFYARLLKEKKPISYENKNYSKNGEAYWILTSLTPLLNESGEVEKIISIDSDITKQKKAEMELITANKIAKRTLTEGNKAMEELHKAKKEVEESLKVKEQFLANMSHEIRTPMNAIIGFTNLLLKKELAAEETQYLNAIKTSGENLLVIINDILDFSKLKSGKITIENIPFKISQLVSTVVDLMLPKAIEKGIKLSSSIDKNIPETLLGDPTRLNQILINLIGNAIKFTQEGGIKINIETLNQTEKEISLKFSVIDTGIGIAPESMEKIFEGFTQATNDTTRKYGGTGLGLTITKQLVELQGGTISVSSKINSGSTFEFGLTFKKDAQKNQDRLIETKNITAALPLETVRILLVEDNLFNQMLAAKVLENWNFKVETAENGLVAIEKVKKNNFDLILMDIQLPEMDGYQATSFIRNKMPSPKNNIPIIAMTAHAFPEEIEKCRSYGMDDYISKPFDETNLHEKILKVLQNKKQVLDGPEPETKPDINKIENSFDLTYLKNASKGDSKFILKMISVFLDQTPELLDRMKMSLETKDLIMIKKVIHKMTPSVVFMGIHELEETLTLMDESLIPEKFEFLFSLYQKAESIATKAMAELKIVKKKGEI